MDLSNHIFINIETVTEFPDLNSLESSNKNAKDIWTDYALRNISKEESVCIFDEYPLYVNTGYRFPDFSKIISVNIGFISSDILIIKTIISEIEYEIVKKLNDFLISFTDQQIICGYDISKFIGPFLSKRFLYNGFSIPKCLRNLQFDDINLKINLNCQSSNIESELELLTNRMNFQVPHNIEMIKRSRFNNKFHNEKDINYVKTYSENHLAQNVNLYLAFLGKERIYKFN